MCIIKIKFDQNKNCSFVILKSFTFLKLKVKHQDYTV